MSTSVNLMSDVADNLLDTAEVADLLGLSSRAAVIVYRKRYPDFPEPAIKKGRCLLWLRPDIEAWAAGR
jgi:predicted DNA-binding transcriptional regulator AlpA